MERARIEQFGGMQRNPVEGLKQGPSLLRNLCFDRAGGYLPFAVAPAQSFLSLSTAIVEGILGHDARGTLVAAEELGGGLAQYVLACGSSSSSSVDDYTASIAREAAVIPRFGAYAQRGSYFGRGLADGSLFIEPLAVRPLIAQDTLDTDGVALSAIEVVSLAYASGSTASRGAIYAVTSAAVVYKIDLDDPEAGPVVLADISGDLGAAAVDIAASDDWIVVLGSNSVVAASSDEFSSTGTQSLSDANLRLSYDSRGDRFWASGGELWQSAADPTAAWTPRADNYGPANSIHGAGVVNIDGTALVAPLSNRSQVASSNDNGVNWDVDLPGTFSRGQEVIAPTAFGVGTVFSNGVATDGEGTVLVAGTDGSVYRRKDGLLDGRYSDPQELVWTRVATEVDGTGVALLDIRWSAGARAWFASSDGGGIFQSADGATWVEAGRVTGAVTRIAVDDEGNWYANEVGGGIAGGVGALGTPVGRYVIAAVAAVPTPAGDIVTDMTSLAVDIESTNPSSLRVSVPATLTSDWLSALTTTEQDAYLEAVRVYVYVGYDPDSLQENPEMYLVKILRLGDAPYSLRREAIEAVATDALQAINLLDFRESITELHNQRVWFTIPNSYEIPLSSATGVPSEAGAPVGSDGYLLAGDSTLSAEFTGLEGREDISGGITITLGSSPGVTILVSAQSRARPTERIALTGSYRSAEITLLPGESATAVLPPADAGSGLPNVEVTLALNAGGTSLTLVNAVAVTPINVSPYGSTDFGYRILFALRGSDVGFTVDVFRADPFGPLIANTELQITSEGSPFTIGWSEQGFVNLADPLNYLKLSASTSTRITDLASGPGQTLVAFCDNEIFSIFGDPGLDVLARVENFGVQRLSAVVGHDADTPVARLGNELFCIHRGQVYAVTGEGVSEQPLSLPVDRRDDPFVQVVGDSIHNHVVGLTASGAILRFDVEKQGWFEDPWSERSVDRLLPRPTCVDSYGARYLIGTSVFGITDPVGQDVTAELEFTDVDLGEKNVTKLWRRVRLHSSDDFEQTIPPVLRYRVRDRFGRTQGRLTETGVWVFTLARGVVGPKIDLSFSFETAASSTLEPPVDIEFVPRYVER